MGGSRIRTHLRAPLPRLGAGLLLAGLWAAGVAATQGSGGIGLVVAGLPLIAVLLGAGGRPSTREVTPETPAPPVQVALALAAPLALLWALNHSALSSWWQRDDPCLLTLIQEHGIWRPFVSSTGSFLIPLQTFSLGIDLSLFGLEPRAFYYHHLISFSVLIVAAYGFLRSFLTPPGSSLALSLFVVSVPAFAIAQQLMNRHYLEGLALALTSLMLYRRSIAGGGRFSQALLGALLYLLATAAKEVFVPLVVLLPLFAGDRRRRWRHAVPYISVAGAYGLWRLYMLGWSNSLSGYGALAGELGFDALWRIPALLGLARPWQVALAAALVVAATVVVGRRFPSSRLTLGVSLVILSAPLVPVAAQLGPRHLFLGTFAIAALLAVALETSMPPGYRLTPLPALAGTVLLLLALTSLTGSHFWRHYGTGLQHYQSEGSFILDDPREGLLLTTANHSSFLQCLAQLRREVLVKPGGPGFCGDPCFCSQVSHGGQRWRYAGGHVAAADAVVDDGCNTRRPVAIDLSHDQAESRISWTFGPYPEGAYEVLLISGMDKPGVSIPVAVPRQGSMPYWLFEPLRFVVKYRSPDGWQTYSEVYTVEPDGHAIRTP